MALFSGLCSFLDSTPVLSVMPSSALYPKTRAHGVGADNHNLPTWDGSWDGSDRRLSCGTKFTVSDCRATRDKHRSGGSPDRIYGLTLCPFFRTCWRNRPSRFMPTLASTRPEAGFLSMTNSLTLSAQVAPRRLRHSEHSSAGPSGRRCMVSLRCQPA